MKVENNGLRNLGIVVIALVALGFANEVTTTFPAQVAALVIAVGVIYAAGKYLLKVW